MSDVPRLTGRPAWNTRARRVRRQHPGRVCADPACATLLSTYNESRYCWIHEGRTLRRTFGRQRVRQAG